MEQQLTQIPNVLTPNPSTIKTTICPPAQMIDSTKTNHIINNDAMDKNTTENLSIKQNTFNQPPAHDEPTHETVHEVSTRRDTRPMAECPIASSLARLSPNHHPSRTTRANTAMPRLHHPIPTANPQRSLNISHQHQSVAFANRYRKDPSCRRSAKRVVFNGTFPIDEPMSSRFDDGYAQGDGSDSDYDEEFYREDDGEEYPDYEDDEYRNDDDGGGEFAPHQCEDGLIVVGSKSAPQNRDQIRAEFQTSAEKFDQLIALRRRDVLLHSVSERDRSSRIGKDNI